MNATRNRFVFTGIGIVAIVLGLLFGTAGVTAYASTSALPGDTLYGVKTTLEQTRLSMARDAAARAGLYMEFAKTRLQEISSLISEQRFQDISTATKDFETYANKAIGELDVVSKGDPQTAAVLTAKISEALSRYARTLTSMLDSVPDGVRQQMSEVIQSAQGQGGPAAQATEVEFEGVVDTIVQGAWIINGKTVFIHTQTEVRDTIEAGDFVKVHALINGDGDLVAREIELSSKDDASNSNSNSNDNANMNSNSNDDNGNLNSNDDNGNLNSNDDNANLNSNDENGNLNSNDDNANLNSNDDNANLNGSDDNANFNGNTNTQPDDSNKGNGNDDSSGKGKKHK